MIQVENLSKNYGKFKAVDSISFSIKENQIAALLGLNGAGKTTTLRMLTGFLAPTSGRIKINGHEQLENPLELKKQIGYMPENPAMYNDMSVIDFLVHMYCLRLATKEGDLIAAQVAIEKVGLVGREHQPIGCLSAGFRKRVGLAQAIVHKPAVLIFDEPISDLDPKQIVEIRNLLIELKKEHTILISSHILSEISQTADVYLFIHEGKLIAEETPTSLANQFGEGCQYEIECSTADLSPDELKNKLSGIEFVSNVIVGARNENSYQIKLTSSKDVRSQVSKFIVDASLDLLKISEIQFNLESYFINLTKSDSSAA